MTTACVLGLDGGGTKTHAILVTPAGLPRGEGTAGPCNIAAVPVADAVSAALAAADMALAAASRGRADVTDVCAAVAGFSHEPRRVAFAAALQEAFPAAKSIVEPDYAAALWGATEGAPGVVVIAGTGSVAFGENATGATYRAGAYGYLIDDAGSGYGVGRALLAAVLRAADGTGPATALTGVLARERRLCAFPEIVSAVYGGALDRAAIAALAPWVAEAAEAGDAVAKSILMHTGGALARLAEVVLTRLFRTSEEPVPVAAVGSLWQSGHALTDVFDRSLARCCPQAARIAPKLPAAHGAALRALREPAVITIG